jgi:DNA-binding CsgD family transcriptional regulator
MDLLERDESMSTLNAALEGVRSGSGGRLLFVAGEAGVGKTALLRTFCEAHGRPVRVLWGACEPLLTPRPLGPIVDIAEATGGELKELMDGSARPYEIAAALVGELQGRAPTVVVLEDVHWADEATLDVITLLAARIAAAHALVLASYRDDEIDRSPQLRFVLGELARRPGRVKLTPLSKPAVAGLAEPYGLDAGELYFGTGGNPFFVTEVLAAGGARIPETARDAVLARAARLSAPARRVLEAVAIVPGQAELWLLTALATDLDERLDECLTSGMLRAGRAHVAFRHELARLAIEDAMAPHRRLALHRAAIAALVAAGGEEPDCARLAHHAEAAGDAEGVLRWAPPAAERAAMSGAHREAAAQWGRALRFAGDLTVDARAELLERRADECWLTDQFDAAIEVQEQALDCRRQLVDRAGEGDALRKLSRLMFFVGRAGEGEALAIEAVKVLEGLKPGHELAMAYANVSQRRMVMDDTEGAVGWGVSALELARRLGDTEATVYALTNVGAAEFRTGSERGKNELLQALELARQHNLEDYAGRAFFTIVRCAIHERRLGLADEHLEPGLRYCSERGLDTWRLYLVAARADLELVRGHWDLASDAAALVLRDPRSATFARGWALTVLGLVRARRGDPQALAPLTEELALAQPTEEADRIAAVAAARAEVAWLAGDHEAVVRETDVALQLAIRYRVAWRIGELAYWRRQVGVQDELPIATIAEPYRLSLAGEWVQAAEMWRALGCPYEAALALADSDGEADVRRAWEELRRLGARPAEAIVARRLRERGVRGVPRGPRRRTRDNPAGLTPRELEVLALLAEGLRNAQIAERLIVSAKTVDHHVSAVLRKLEVRTRGEASSAAMRLGLLDPR